MMIRPKQKFQTKIKLLVFNFINYNNDTMEKLPSLLAIRENAYGKFTSNRMFNVHIFKITMVILILKSYNLF